MATNSQVNQNVSLAGTAALLTRPNRMSVLNATHQNANFITAMTHIQQKIGMGAAMPVDTADGKITSAIIDTASLSEQVISRNMSGSNLVLTIAANHGPLFRLGMVVSNDNASKEGIVLSVTANTVTIAPLATETLAVANFPVNGYVTEGSQLVPNRGSDAVQGRTIMPRLVENLMPTYRVNRSFDLKDFVGNDAFLIKDALAQAKGGNFSGIESAIIRLQVGDMAYDMHSQLEYASIFSKEGVEIVDGKEANRVMGFLESVDLRGGLNINSTSVITWAQHIGIVGDVFSGFNRESQEVICFAGHRYIDRVVLGAAAQGYKVTAGTNSVLVGSGLNFKTIEVPQGVITFVNLGLFNDNNKFKGVSNTGYRALEESCLYVSVTKMKDYYGNTVAPIEKYYGAWGGNSEGIHMLSTNGIIDHTGKFAMNSASQISGLTIGQICMEAYVAANAQPLGYFMYKG